MTLRSIPSRLGHLADVDTTTTAPADGDAVVWDATNGEWVPGAAAVDTATIQTAGRWEVVVSGTAPPVAVTNEAEDDWIYGWVSD